MVWQCYSCFFIFQASLFGNNLSELVPDSDDIQIPLVVKRLINEVENKGTCEPVYPALSPHLPIIPQFVVLLFSHLSAPLYLFCIASSSPFHVRISNLDISFYIPHPSLCSCCFRSSSRFYLFSTFFAYSNTLLFNQPNSNPSPFLNFLTLWPPTLPPVLQPVLHYLISPTPFFLFPPVHHPSLLTALPSHPLSSALPSPTFSLLTPL